jgi:hypothetical protein
MSNISKSNIKLVDIINKKLLKNVKNKKALETFSKHINSIKGSISELKKFNEKVNLVSDKVNTMSKLKQIDINQRNKARELKNLSPSTFNYKKEIDRSTHTFNLPVFKNHKNKINKVIDLINKNKLINKDFIVHQKKKSNKPEIKALYKGKEVLNFGLKGKFTRKDVQQLGDKISNMMYGSLGEIAIALKYNYGWRSGYFTKFGEKVQLYSPVDSDITEDQDEFSEIYIYMLEDPSSKGGKSNMNNCLYDCLKSVLQNNLPFKEPIELKKYLKLWACDKVDYKLIPLIEQKLKTYAINISGDHTYISPIKSKKVINLLLEDEHYTVIEDHISKVNKNHISYKSRKPIIYNKYTFMAYDGEKEWLLSNEQKYDIYKFKTPYILVDKTDPKLTLKEEYDLFIHDANLLKEASDGQINLYQTGNTKTTCLNVFDTFTKYIKNPPKPTQLEADWISDCSHGAIIFHDKYSGPVYKYDKKSMYPSIMKSKQLFPVDAGEFTQISELSEILTFGIYRCIIKKSNTKIDRLFRFNPKNKYSHIDIYHARKLNLEIKLINDNEANTLLWTRDNLLTGTELFGQFIDFTFDLKNKLKIDRAKKIINTLWGALCEKKTKNFVCGPDVDIGKNAKPISIRPTDDGKTIIEIIKRDNQYVSGFSRIKPFLLGKARSIMSDIMLPYNDLLVRCHTDGFMSTQELDIKIGDQLGDLVYEGNSNVIISACNQIQYF